jgi:hypothetical protein
MKISEWQLSYPRRSKPDWQQSAKPGRVGFAPKFRRTVAEGPNPKAAVHARQNE